MVFDFFIDCKEVNKYYFNFVNIVYCFIYFVKYIYWLIVLLNVNESKWCINKSLGFWFVCILVFFMVKCVVFLNFDFKGKF